MTGQQLDLTPFTTSLCAQTSSQFFMVIISKDL